MLTRAIRNWWSSRAGVPQPVEKNLPDEPAVQPDERARLHLERARALQSGGDARSALDEVERAAREFLGFGTGLGEDGDQPFDDPRVFFEVTADPQKLGARVWVNVVLRILNTLVEPGARLIRNHRRLVAVLRKTG